jgi:hypothetical protein
MYELVTDEEWFRQHYKRFNEAEAEDGDLHDEMFSEASDLG